MNPVNQSLTTYISVIYILLAPVCAVVVYYYAEDGFPWHSYFTLFLGLYAALGILLLIPLDISVVVYDRRSTTVGYDSNYEHHVYFLSQIYNTYFTMVLILGSVVLVFEEYYNTDGYFTIPSKLISAFSRMCFDLVGPAVVGGIVLGILIGKKVVPSNTDALKLTLVVMTNTIYELMLVILLAYSLVEYPRSIWRKADYKASLLKMQIKASHQFRAIKDAHFNVSLTVGDVLKTKQALNSYADPELNDAMDILTSECPPGFHADRAGEVAQNKQGKITIDTLAKLRTRLNVKKDEYKMAKAKVEVTKLLAYTLEDLAKAVEDPSSGKIHWSLTDEDSTEEAYLWHMQYKPTLLKVSAAICGCFSILSFLGVICSMKGVSNNVSPYFLTVHGPNVNPVGICFFIFLSFGYTVYITVWAIFEIKMGAAYELVPSQTTPEALSFNVRMVARLAAPLAFFYLGWISENGIRSGPWSHNDAPNGIYYQNVTVPISMNTTNNSTSSSLPQNITYVTELQMINSTAINMPSAFSHFYQLQAIGTVQEVFGTMFPCVLYVVLGLFLLNIFNRVLVLFKLDNYQFGTEIVTEDQLKEGRKQLERERASTIGRYKRERLKSMISSFLNKSKEDDTSRHNKEENQTGGFFSFFLGKKTTTNYLPVGETLLIKEPQELNGIIERKNQNTLQVGANWKELYAEVRSPGYLHLYKDKKTADANRSFEPARSSDPQATVIDLTLVNQFLIPEKKNKDNLELHLELADEKFKFKFKSMSEVERWRSGLQEWKSFALDYGTLYPYGLGNSDSSASALDIESVSTQAANPSVTPLPIHRHLTNELESIQPLLPADNKAEGSSWFGWTKPKKRDLYESIFNTESSSMFDQKPASLEGWLEKKAHGKVVGGEWQKRYVRIDEERGVLTYSKSSDPKEKTGGTIDLRLVKDIVAYEKNAKLDASRFNIDCGEKVYKFKARDEQEGQMWLDGLNSWRDYFVLHH